MYGRATITRELALPMNPNVDWAALQADLRGIGSEVSLLMTYLDDFRLDEDDPDPRWRAYECVNEGRYAEALVLIRDLGGLACMQSMSGDSILHDAASDGLTELLVGLLRDASPEQVDMLDSHGMTALAWATCEGHAECVAALLEAGAEPDRRTSEESALCAAINRRHVAVVDALLAGGADPDWRARLEDDASPLACAIANKDADMVARLLRAGADPNHESDLERMTPLGHAVCEGHVESVVVLLAAGAEPDRRDEERNDWTPLCRAAMDGHAELVDILLRAGADPDIPCWMGQSARHHAERRSDDHPVFVLMSKYPNRGSQR